MTLDERALAALVREQRWFGAKSRAVSGVRIVARAPLARHCTLALLDVAFAEGRGELYQLPYRGTGHGRAEISLADPALAGALAAALRRRDPIETGAGRIEFARRAAPGRARRPTRGRRRAVQQLDRAR